MALIWGAKPPVQAPRSGRVVGAAAHLPRIEKEADDSRPQLALPVVPPKPAVQVRISCLGRSLSMATGAKKCPKPQQIKRADKKQSAGFVADSKAFVLDGPGEAFERAMGTLKNPKETKRGSSQILLAV